MHLAPRTSRLAYPDMEARWPSFGGSATNAGLNPYSNPTISHEDSLCKL